MSLFVQIFMVLIHFFVQLLLYLNFCCCHIAVSDLYHMYHMCRCGLGSRGALQLWAWRACGIGELGSCRVVEFWIRGSVDVQELGGCGRGRVDAWMCGHVGLWRGELRTCGFVQLWLFLRSRLSLEVSHDMWMEESYWFASKSFRSELFQKFRLSSDDS